MLSFHRDSKGNELTHIFASQVFWRGLKYNLSAIKCINSWYVHCHLHNLTNNEGMLTLLEGWIDRIYVAEWNFL